MVRPEDLVAGTSGIVATVRISEYRGRAFFGAAQAIDGTELFFRSDRPVAAGERVTLGARPDQILVFPGDGA